MIGVVVYRVGCARAGPAGQAGGAWPLVPVSAGGRLCLSGLEPSLTDYLDARHGWSRGAADEPALGHLGYPQIIRSGCGDGETRPVTVGERVGGQAVRDHAEQYGEGDH
jgi:hypothetical protein